MARTGVHRLENRLQREQSWQTVTDRDLGETEQIAVNKNDHESQKRMGRTVLLSVSMSSLIFFAHLLLSVLYHI